MKKLIFDEIPPHQDLKAAREDFDLAFAKKLMAKLIRLIKFKEICPHYDCSAYVKLIDILEKGYNLNLYQIERIDNAYELLINNPEILDFKAPNIEEGSSTGDLGRQGRISRYKEL